MMKKISLALVALLLTAAAVGCSPKPADPQTSTEPVESAQEQSVSEAAEPASSQQAQLVMATEPGFRPYEYYEGTEVVGVDVDIAQEIAKEMNRELVVESMEFNAIIPAVNSGKADFGAAGMSITPDRQEQVDFTIEYATSKQVILTKNESTIVEEKDLDNKNIGVQLGTVADIALTDDYPDVTVVQYNKYMEAVNDLLSGRIDAIVLDALPAQELLQMDESLVVREKELFTDVYAFCVKKGNTELLNAINTVMQRLLDEGKIAEFTTKHTAG